MAGRILLFSVVAMILLLTVGCGSSAQLSGVSVTPATVSFETNIPSPDFVPTTVTAQLTATGTYSNGKTGRVYYKDITDQVNWTTALAAVATVTSAGVVSPAGCGVGVINANASGGLIASASINVCTQSGSDLGSLTSLKVLSPPQTLSNRGDKAQFIALGTYAGSNATKDLTDKVKWSTSDTRVATTDAAGLVTLSASCSNVGSGPEATITAVAPGGGGSSLTAAASVVVEPCGSSSGSTLIVHQAGEGSGKVVSNPDEISCSGGDGCIGNFALSRPVTLTATPDPGSIFGGFSASCAPVIPDPSGCPASLREAGVKSCTCLTTTVNAAAVGAIFNTGR